MSVRASFFESLTDTYDFNDCSTDGVESRADSPILGFESDTDFPLPKSLRTSQSFASVSMSPLPPACPPMRRYSRQTSASSAASIRNAVYADPELEENLHATLRHSVSMQAMRHLNGCRASRARAFTIPNNPSAEASSTRMYSESSARGPQGDAAQPVASSSLSRRRLPLGKLSVDRQIPRADEAAGQNASIPYNPEYPSPTTPTTSFNRYSSEAPSEPPSTPSLSTFHLNTGASSRASTPDTSPASTWSRADGRKALDSMIMSQAQDPSVWERNSSHWSIASSTEEERIRPMSRRIFGHSVDALSSFASGPAAPPNKSAQSHEATLRRLEGFPSTAPVNGTFDTEQAPRTPKKRTRLRSFMSRLSHLPSPHASNPAPPPPTPVLFSQNNFAGANEDVRPVAYESLLDTDPFRAPGMSMLEPPSDPSYFPQTQDSPPAKRPTGRSRVRSLFFQS